MRTVALYMRLSSEDAGAGESVSIANQRELLFRFIRERREFDGCEVLEFCDDGYSGMNFDRPGVKKLLSLAGKTVSCILVKDFSRFGRNLVEVGDYLDQIFPFLGVRFIAVNEGYDSARGYGSSVGLDVSLKTMVYEMYSRDISEKTRCVQQAKMRKGEYLCAIAFYGYKRSETAKNSLEADGAAAKVVRRIFQMAADGVKPSGIAAKLNLDGIPSPLMYRRANHTDGLRGWKTAGDIAYWTRENVRRIISDKRYTGCLIGRKRTVADISAKRTQPVPEKDWIVVENTQEALVSEKLFIQAQTVLRHTAKKTPPRKPYQKFRGLVKCGCCNRALTRTVCKQTYFSCPAKRTAQGRGCINIYLEGAALEDVLLTVIQAQIRLFMDTALKTAEEEAEGRLGEELRASRSAASRYKALQAAAFEDYAEGKIDKREYLARKGEITAQQKKAESRFEELSRQLAQTRQTGKDTFIHELTREILVELVKEIRVGEKDAIEILWNFNLIREVSPLP